MYDDPLGQSPDPTFYLVLKGEVMIFHDTKKKSLLLLAPEVPAHVYMAGPWLSPMRIPKGSRLRLENVKPGKATPEDHKEFLLRLPNAKPQSDLARFEIEAPLPRTILAGALQDASNLKITVQTDQGWEPLPQKPEFTCLAAILVYDWDGSNEPLLSDPRSGVTWTCGGKLEGLRSLHVCASAERGKDENDTGHARQAFIKAAAALGVTADIAFDGDAAFTPTVPPPGLNFLEINAAYYETLQLGQALGEILEGGPGEIPKIQARKFQDGNCGPIAG